MEELAKRAVACKHWRWMPGMLIQNADGPVRIDAVDCTQPGVLRKCHFTNEIYVADVRSGPLPDLTDPATLGCLLALVREAWRWPNAFACHDETGWCVLSGETGCCVELQDEAGDGERYDTEAEALVAALEAAP